MITVIGQSISGIKRYKMATDRFSDFELGMDVVINLKRMMTGAASDGLKLQLIRNCHVF